MARVWIGFCLILAGCGGSTYSNPMGPSPAITVIVKYVVTGSGTSRAHLTYQTQSGGSAQISPAALPWSYEFTSTPRSGDFLYISAQNANETGCVTVEIIKRDVSYKKTQSCGAFVIATADGSY